MRSRVIFYILFACIITSLCVGCYDDKGNYDYVEAPELRIDTAGLGILPEYAISRFDRLTIAPNIYLNGKLVNDDADAPLDYLWTMYVTTAGVGVDYKIDTLGTSRVLDTEITRSPEAYNVLLTVTNRENGLQSYFKVICGVEGTIPFGGWLVFYERADKPGTSDVGQIINKLTKPTALYEKVFWNLYSSSNGEPLQGKPVKVSHTICAFPPNTEVVLSTDKDMVFLNQTTFSRIGSYSDFFFEAPANPGVSAYEQYAATAGGEVIISNNKLFMVAAMGKRNLFGTPRIENYGELASWLCLFHNPSNLEAVVYDQTNGCFLYAPPSNVKLVPFKAQSADAAFDVNNVGAKLVMGDWGYGNYEYLVMNKDNNYHLAVANFNTSTTDIDKFGVGWYDMSTSPEVSKMVSISAAFNGLYVLYGAGSSVYNFFYTTGQPAKQLWKAPSADEVVTCVKLQKYGFLSFQTIMPNAHKVLHIATWNEKTQEGKLYQYSINPTDATLMGEPIIYTVPGKVMSMGWKVAMPGT